MESEGHCGPASIINALRCYNHWVGEKTVARLASTTKERGTDTFGMWAAVEALGYKHPHNVVTSQQLAIYWLDSCIEEGTPTILYFYNGSHYVTCIGKVAGSYIVIDSAWYKYLAAENGVRILDRKNLLKLWRADNWDRASDIYEGFQVVKRGKAKKAGKKKSSH